MQSAAIVASALAMILAGAAVLYYQRTGTRRLEVLLIVVGVALVAGGIAMLRDGVEGRRKFLWMLPSTQSLDHQLVNTAQLSSRDP